MEDIAPGTATDTVESSMLSFKDVPKGKEGSGKGGKGSSLWK